MPNIDKVNRRELKGKLHGNSVYDRYILLFVKQALFVFYRLCFEGFW